VRAASAPGRSRSSTLTLPQLWGFLAVSLPVMAALLAPILTDDSAYIVRSGEIMLETGTVLRTDPFTFTAGGTPWLNQQWGAEILFAATYSLGGWSALAILRAALVGAIFFLVYRSCRAAGAQARIAAWLTLAGFAVAIAGLGVRPQIFAMVLFALLVWILAVRRERPGLLWLAPPMVALWANLHGTFFLAPLLLGLAWLEDRHERRPGAGRTLIVALISAMVVVLNPFGIRVWEYLIQLSTNPVVGRISEWGPPDVRSVSGLLFFASAVIVAWVLVRYRRRVGWPALLQLGVLLSIALFSTRGSYWWALAAPTMVAAILAGDGSFPSRAPPPKPWAGNTVVAALVVAGAVAALPWWRGPALSHAPPGVTAELEASLGPRDRIFNSRFWGSWFELSLPDNPVFIDSRAEVFPPKVHRDWRVVSAGASGWETILDRWQVAAVAAHPVEQGTLIEQLARDLDWVRTYRGRDGSVFLRTPQALEPPT